MNATQKQVDQFVEHEVRAALSQALEQQARYASAWLAYLDRLADENNHACNRASRKARPALYRRGRAIGRARQLVGAVLCQAMRDAGPHVAEMIAREYPGSLGQTLAGELRTADPLDGFGV